MSLGPSTSCLTEVNPVQIEDLKQYWDRLLELEAFIKVDEAKSSVPDIQTRILRRKLDFNSECFFLSLFFPDNVVERTERKENAARIALLMLTKYPLPFVNRQPAEGTIRCL